MAFRIPLRCAALAVASLCMNACTGPIERVVVVPSGTAPCESVCATFVGRETLVGYVVDTQECVEAQSLDYAGHTTNVAVCRLWVQFYDPSRHGDTGDLDADLFLNASDACPFDAEEYDGVADEDGCPEP